MTELPGARNDMQISEKLRNSLGLNYESPALTAELQALPADARTSNIQCSTSNSKEGCPELYLKFCIADCRCRIWDDAVIRGSLAVVEIVILSALVLATRCANYQDVFVAGNIYFVDADCYARMTRVRMCGARPGLIVRHHDFENFPRGTTAHTTAPLDYLILGLALPLKPFTTQPLDMSGAFVSPLLALAGAWFLWWWSRQMKFRYRWVTLILFAISPILVHGTELGRPDHQSLLILLVTIGICAEWRLQTAADPPSPSSGVAGIAAATELNRLAAVSGAAWGFA